jgi:hypothetical protein
MSNNLEPIHGVIARVRRAMPRNGEVMLICDELEKLMAHSSVAERGAVNAQAAGSIPAESAKPKLSRAEIQKNYRLRKKSKL